MNEALPYVAIAISGLTLAVLIVEKLWGGGNALANKFHALEKDTVVAISEVRKELGYKVDNYESQASVGFESTRSSIHSMQLESAGFRAKVAEDLHAYIRKDDYNAGIGDLKRDLQMGFRNVEDRMGQMQDLILYSNPDAANRIGKTTAPSHK